MIRNVQVTLTNAATDYNLKTLIAAIANIVPVDGYFPYQCCELQIQYSNDNGAGVLQIKETVGGVGVDMVVPGSAQLYRTTRNNINLKDFILRTDTAGFKVNVSVNGR